ncbi:SDR family oxidoreductase [Telmatocola sphagniphila]|uniref:SDR family oxidoreductase n=1 Tax=Telmatocola sphagniphila TaxID=1123043 RepID=A0A8E6B109_9BACT|nr:SDR family oxidoreductase [Telmatocola sphagniphila]QVL29910.1 SDR family oxidoreductase [Telmatocola sphagniphila]
MHQSNYVVLGASGGIASETVRRLVAKGSRVLLAGRSEQKLVELAVELNQPTFALDVTNSKEVDTCFAEALRLFGKIDGVLHAVGSILLKPAHLTTDEEWHSTIRTNLDSAFYVVRAATKAMMNGEGGSIVLFSSAAARIGLVNHEAIAAAKAGIIGLVLATAASYGNKNIRINAIAPGLVETPLTFRLTSNEASLKASKNMHALGSIGEPCDIASAAEWLLDPSTRWVTGQVIGIDGGLSSVRSRT